MAPEESKRRFQRDSRLHHHTMDTLARYFQGKRLCRIDQSNNVGVLSVSSLLCILSLVVSIRDSLHRPPLRPMERRMILRDLMALLLKKKDISRVRPAAGGGGGERGEE